jgi:DNA-binding IclR family transcriptional regulator
MDALFGSQTRTDVLVALASLGTTYLSELARLLGYRLTEVQRAVASLERSGAVVTRTMGRTRLVELNPRCWGYGELSAFLLRMSELPVYADRFAVRRRPRAMGKSL